MRRNFILLLFIMSFTLQAQQWTIVGDTAASDWEVAGPMVAVNKFGTPYIVYKDNRTTPRATVKKFDGTNWIQVGPDINAGDVLSPSMCFDTSGIIPYVAYVDMSDSGRTTVKKFDGENWITVGEQGFTPGGGGMPSIKIDKNNIPYVAFRDLYYNYRASVMKFNGTTWQYVGTPGFSPQFGTLGGGGIAYPALVFDPTGTPYVAFVDVANDFWISVMKYNGSSWTYVGQPNISNGSAGETSMVMDSKGSLYVTYNKEISGKATVKKFDGTSWVPVGGVDITPGAAGFPDIAIDKYDNLYLAFADYTNNEKASVMIYNGFTWAPLGSLGFSPAIAHYTTIDVSNNGEVYCAFKDNFDHYGQGFTHPYHPACVMKITNPTVGIKKETSSSFLLNVYPNPTSALVQINYNPIKESKGALRITNANGQLIYKEEFTGSYNKEVMLGKYSKGVYFIEIKTPEATERKKIVLE